MTDGRAENACFAPGSERAKAISAPIAARVATSDEPPAPRPAPRAVAGKKGALNAPMPGVILEVNVKPGDTVTRGQQVAILDAMKMHNVIGAPRAGTIAEVFVSAGQSVNHGDAIVSFTGD